MCPPVRIAIYAFATLLPLFAAGAANAAGKDESPADSAADASAGVAMSMDDCRRLMARIGGNDLLHTPRPDVTYQPGRDVDSQGRPIVPADLPGSNPLPLDKMIELPIRIPLSSIPGLKVPSSIADESTLRIARLAVDPLSGRLTFDGQPLAQQTEDGVAAACRDYLSRQPPGR